MADSILIGLSALQAHKRLLEVTSHNIANAATPGYSRQSVQLKTDTPESIRPGQIGRGVLIDSIKRISDPILIDRLRDAQAETGRLDGLVPTLESLESTFNEPGDNGLTASVNRLFASFDDLSNNPESAAIRSKAVQDLEALTTTFNDLDSKLTQLKNDLRAGLADMARQINGLTAEISDLNQSIRRETLLGNHPNDLLDRRDLLLNQLSNLADVKVQFMANDNSAVVTLGGRLVYDNSGAAQVEVGSNGLGDLALVFSDNKASADVTGGRVGAILTLSNDIIPELQAKVDDFAEKFIYNLNAAHAVGVNDNFDGSIFLSEFTIADSARGADLDDEDVALGAAGVGIPANFQPTFVDENGDAIERNLTINVYDTATGLAQKYIVRYEPGSASVPATRSFDDLLSAINTGRGGGFRLYPPSAGGIPGVTARAVADDGGVRLRLEADVGKSIDFSMAQDVRPSDDAWTSPATTVTGSDVSLANQRLEFEVQTVAGPTKQLRVFTRDPDTGAEVPYGAGTVNLPGGGVLGSLTIAGSGLAADYTDGETFSIDFDSTGTMVDGSPHVESPTWTLGDASMTVRGRYTGSLSYDPSQPWTMRVLSSGVVGADDSAAIPNNPPIVQFTYYDKQGSTITQHVIQKTLNQSLKAGDPVEIADGIYVVFSSGALTATNELEFIVDGDPDQAGLLPGLGINGMMQGYEAGTMQVSDRLKADPSQLGVAHTRAAGDNANVTTFSGLRSRTLFGTGQTFDDSYQATVFDIGVQVSQTKRFQDNQSMVEKTLQNRRDAENGVSIDEEVGNLILEQQAYAAAARVITASKENIDTLMSILA